MPKPYPTHPRRAASLAVVLLIAACGSGGSDARTAAARKTLVETAMPTLESVTDTIRAVGTIGASEHAEIRPQVEGVLAEVAFREGAQVEEGDVLARLDDRKARASRNLARAALDRTKAGAVIAKQKLARHKRLIEEKLIAEETFEEALAESHRAEAEMREKAAALELAESQLADYSIVAPFRGTVGALLVDVGNFIEKGSALTYVLRTDVVEVEFGVPDRYSNRITTGTTLTVKTAAETAEGTIVFIDPRVDAVTRLLKVKAEIPNGESKLKPGQFAEVAVTAAVRDRQVVIPEQAVVSTEGKTFVFVVVDGTASRRRVELGARMPERVEVLSGLSGDLRVIVGGQHRISDGDPVEEISPDEPVETVGAKAAAPTT